MAQWIARKFPKLDVVGSNPIRGTKGKYMKKFVVKVEGIAPVILNLEVQANSAEEALYMLDGNLNRGRLVSPPEVQLKTVKKKTSKVMEKGSNTVQLKRTYF